MAWSWSHTPEAYENAELNVKDLSRAQLREVVAEIRTNARVNPCGAHEMGRDFDADIYSEEYTAAIERPVEELAEEVWKYAEERRTCTDGGWEAWICPYGCHTVPFDRDEPSS